MSIRVQNLNGTSSRTPCYSCGSWFDHWKTKFGFASSVKINCAACAATDKKEVPATLGGHVKVVGASNTAYIVPLCDSCNKRSDEFMAGYSDYPDPRASAEPC